MNVVVDFREQTRITKARDYYEDVMVEELEVGDYLFDDTVVFEYKTFEDFIASIFDGRVFNQAVNQFLEYKYHFVILELGVGFDLEASLDEQEYLRGVCVTKEQYYGAIARLNTYTTVIPVCGDSKDCFQVMETQARKCLEDKTLVKHYNIKTGNSALNYLCNNVQRVSLVKAEAIADGLELETLEDLLDLNKEKLVSVEGVGDKTAESILKQIRRDKHG